MNNYIIDYQDPILITGANGFIGKNVVSNLIEKGFCNIKCLVRPSGNHEELYQIIKSFRNKAKVEIIEGNLLSTQNCKKAVDDAAVVYHLAAGIEKSFPGCFMNSVVATRNLLDAVVESGKTKRFLNVSSLAVYSNNDASENRILEETSDFDCKSHLRYEAYTYGKVKQDELLMTYAEQYKLAYVIVRPGEVYGRGKKKIPGKVGIDTFGIFFHLGGMRKVPLTNVEHCAEAIVLAGITKGIDGEVFNIIDDDIPTSRDYLKLYKKNVRRFHSIRMPYLAWYLFCCLWEKYSDWSGGQLPPAFNRRRCIAGLKRVDYSNHKAKEMLNWKQKASTKDALLEYFKYLKKDSVNQ
jgi:nucleoside-diphosphate-sugar epimerase